MCARVWVRGAGQGGSQRKGPKGVAGWYTHQEDDMGELVEGSGHADSLALTTRQVDALSPKGSSRSSPYCPSGENVPAPTWLLALWEQRPGSGHLFALLTLHREGIYICLQNSFRSG